MRASGTKANSTNQYRGLGDQLYDLGGARPTLDLNFANNESLVDSVTGKNLVTHTRASSATYADGDGVIQSATTNTPRFDHNPATGESLGLLVEEARTNLLNRSDLGSIGALSGTTRTLTTETNPAGEAESRKLQCTAENATHRISIGSSSANTVTVSAFVKKDTHRYVNIGYGGLSNSFTALFDIEPGLTSDRLLGQGIKGNASNNTNISAGYQDYPNNWVRIWATGTTTGSNGFSLQLAENATAFSLNNWTADGTEAIYVWGGQLEDDAAFPSSLILTNGSTVTRAADVTEITGNDFGTFNQAHYSEDLQQWSGISGAAVKPNQIVSPIGTKTADLLYGSTSAIPYWLRTISLTNGQQYTFSVYLKAATTSGAPCLTLFYGTRFNSDGSNLTVSWNLTTGVPENVSSGLTASMTDVGNGWYRCQATATATITGNYASQWIRMSSDTSDVYAWGAQLEESSTATPYVKSDVTFTSRASTATYYDYNGVIRTAAVDEARDVAFLPDGLTGNFVSAGELLLEEAGTNLLKQSEDFVTLWSPDTEFTFTKTESAPDGTNNATIFTPTTTSALKRQKIVCTVSNLGAHTFSVYAKAAGYNRFEMQYNGSTFNPGSTSVRVRYYLGTEEVQQIGTAGTNVLTSLVSVGNGWYRCSLTADALTTTNAACQIRVANDSNSTTFAGDGTSGIIFWGAQFEEGSVASSYIPTNGAEVTRAADVSSSSPSTFGNSWYDQTKSTAFVDYHKPFSGNWPGYQPFFRVEGHNPYEYISFGNANGNNSTTVYWTSLIGGTNYLTYKQYDTGSGGDHKHAIAITTNDGAFSYEGSVSTRTDNSITMPDSFDKASIGEVNCHIKRIAYWPERLTNDSLDNMTN